MNRALFVLSGLSLLACGMSHAAEVFIEKTVYGGWQNCYRITNGEIEAVVTTDVGPRIMRFGFVEGQNLLKEYEDQLGKTGGEEWRIYGGHRLWHAPEEKPRTYAPDNGPVAAAVTGGILTLVQPVEETTGVQKSLAISMEPDANAVTIVHTLKNENPWDVTFAPWALTVMAPGGRLIVPQEPYISHEEKLLPARPVVLWHYTDMSDPRWTWGKRYIQLRQDDAVEGSQKIGVKNAPGWAAYSLNGELFMKRFPLDADKEYPDFGCNFEAYTAKGMLEIESLGPLVALAANGGTACHTERWFLFKCQPGETDDAINADVLPLIEESGAIIARQIMAEPQDISEDLAREHSLRMWGVMRNAKQR
ncbi:MAG TPA: hypothetical protein PLM14_00070 [Candidatus Hydrogenedentes bacterium]|nr:hypothetical protein [Candidatus Hydrogenedentota bacterium]HQH50946.1 hypothetical protein [Candidatus Hydrogenedentota bacterium]